MTGKEFLNRSIKDFELFNTRVLNLRNQAEYIRPEVTMNLIHSRQHEIVLAFEVIVEAPLRDAASLHDFIDAGCGIALCAKETDSAIQKLLPAYLLTHEREPKTRNTERMVSDDS
jgi:hypothetical protein